VYVTVVPFSPASGLAGFTEQQGTHKAGAPTALTGDVHK